MLTMTYEDLAEEFKGGAKIRRSIWGVFDYIFVGIDGYGKPAICDSVGYTKNLTTEDLFATDWELIEE